jgi:CheY-like chemotaxis protein
VNTSILILVVEDDEIIRETVQIALTDGGYDVVLASTGDEAMAKLDGTGTDLRALVTDVDLPPGHLTGWDVARHAREITPELPVLYMTGASGGEWASKGVPRSVLLAKPFAPAQLVTAVSQLLNATTSMRME